jgi:hexosaminidase
MTQIMGSVQRSIFCLICFLFSGSIAAQESCSVIPMPQSYQPGNGFFQITETTPIIVSDPSLQNLAAFLQKELQQRNGIAVNVQFDHASPGIELSLNKSKPGEQNKKEAYSLSINPKRIIINASSEEGIFYGITSLLQSLRQVDLALIVSSCEIHDEPRYKWRGFMLDESRHFFGKEKVKSLLDWMAFYKLNRFHWHLTDEPGWRIEIRKYPRLTTVGGIGEFKNPDKPAQFYSQADIKEIIAYATERFIVVIPEIDMPGHAAASNRAYPEFSGGGSPDYPDFTFNPGKESTYQFITNILKEVDTLFPSQMIHLGGDEVQYGNATWQTDEHVKMLRTQKNLRDLKAVEFYFIQRMADSIAKLNNRVLAWDEIIDANLTNKPIIFWWRHDKPFQLKKAMDKGYETVLCPRLPLYFDFVQDSSHKVGRRWKDSFNSLENLYTFSHKLFPETRGKDDLILGVQGNVWTETIVTPERLDYMVFPRIAALAETAWSFDDKKNFDDFNIRLKNHLKLYDKANLYYYDPFEPKNRPEALK